MPASSYPSAHTSGPSAKIISGWSRSCRPTIAHSSSAAGDHVLPTSPSHFPLEAASALIRVAICPPLSTAVRLCPPGASPPPTVHVHPDRAPHHATIQLSGHRRAPAIHRRNRPSGLRTPGENRPQSKCPDIPDTANRHFPRGEIAEIGGGRPETPRHVGGKVRRGDRR
jgi:hypothetical protein